MIIGIVANTSKKNVFDIVEKLAAKIEEYGLSFFISDTLVEINNNHIPTEKFLSNEELFHKSTIVLSIGGDGTMLHTAYDARYYSTPLLGVNFGKLGFLAEFDINNMDRIIRDLKEDEYEISQRLALEGRVTSNSECELYAVNDFVIDKGRWPKMIKITIIVDDEYVSTISADGIIIATPTGSTGYSLSVGGPIISPKTNAIVLSPISPHTLTMRPLVISSKQKIKLKVESEHNSIQLNSDGQRVNDFETPVEFEFGMSSNPVKLVHTKAANYFEILRNKLYWGIDVRKNRG